MDLYSEIRAAQKRQAGREKAARLEAERQEQEQFERRRNRYRDEAAAAFGDKVYHLDLVYVGTQEDDETVTHGGQLLVAGKRMHLLLHYNHGPTWYLDANETGVISENYIGSGAYRQERLPDGQQELNWDALLVAIGKAIGCS